MGASWDELREQARRAEHDEQQLTFLRGEAARLEKLLDERRGALSAEASDVKELEEDWLSRWILEWLGTREGRLERERREWIEARLRFEQTRDERTRIATCVGRLESSAGARAHTLRAWEQARDRRAAEIAARGGRDARRLAELQARLDERERRRFEHEEARAVCGELEAELRGLVDALDETWSHGAADLVAAGYGANRNASAGKFAGLNRAQAHLSRAADALRRLRGELADTGLRVELALELPTGLSVADWWLDSLLTDWLTQRRVTESRRRVAQVLDAVVALASRLQQACSALDGEMERDRKLLERALSE